PHNNCGYCASRNCASVVIRLSLVILGVACHSSNHHGSHYTGPPSVHTERPKELRSQAACRRLGKAKSRSPTTNEEEKAISLFQCPACDRTCHRLHSLGPWFELGCGADRLLYDNGFSSSNRHRNQ